MQFKHYSVQADIAANNFAGKNEFICDLFKNVFNDSVIL